MTIYLYKSVRMQNILKVDGLKYIGITIFVKLFIRSAINDINFLPTMI